MANMRGSAVNYDSEIKMLHYPAIQTVVQLLESSGTLLEMQT